MSLSQSCRVLTHQVVNDRQLWIQFLQAQFTDREEKRGRGESYCGVELYSALHINLTYDCS